MADRQSVAWRVAGAVCRSANVRPLDYEVEDRLKVGGGARRQGRGGIQRGNKRAVCSNFYPHHKLIGPCGQDQVRIVRLDFLVLETA